ncbi:hypothetical protein FRX31_023005, partial [Thalictrum thalictroides]
MKEWWEEVHYEGRASYIWWCKIKYLKEKLKIWNREVFGNVEEKIKLKVDQIEVIDRKEETDVLEDGELVERVMLKCELEELVRQKEIKWQQKVKMNWRVNGENMTSYYHKLVNWRRKSNQLQVINIEGEEVMDEEQITQHVVQYYQNLFDDDGSTRPLLNGMEFMSISADECNQMERGINEEE